MIGKRGKGIKADKIGDYVCGVTLAADWSLRDYEGTARPNSFNLGKNFDLSGSLGPCIVVGERDPQNVDVETSVDGKVRQKYNSQDSTKLAADGTRPMDLFLKVGSTVDISSPKIGLLDSRIVSA